MMRLSDAVKGLPGRLVSDGEFQCIAYATEREQESFLTFFEKAKFASALENPNISCILTVEEMLEYIPAHIRGVFVCDAPRTQMFALHNRLAENRDYVGDSFETRIGEGCSISPLAVIDPQNVVIGDRVVIEPFVQIKGRVTIGNDVVIRAGAVLGGKGFSFAHNAAGENVSVKDTAQIILEDGVEIFEQASVSTGIFPWEKTVIGANTKLDTKAFVAHGSHVGRNCLIVAGACICGNCRIGDHVWVGAGAIVSNRIHIGDHARVSLGAVVTKHVPAGMTVSGNFAIEHKMFLHNLKKSIEGYDEYEHESTTH